MNIWDSASNYFKRNHGDDLLVDLGASGITFLETNFLLYMFGASQSLPLWANQAMVPNAKLAFAMGASVFMGSFFAGGRIFDDFIINDLKPMNKAIKPLVVGVGSALSYGLISRMGLLQRAGLTGVNFWILAGILGASSWTFMEHYRNLAQK